MDSLTAKRVFIALAKKLSYSSVQRCNHDHCYKLKLFPPSGNAYAVLKVQIDERLLWTQELLFKSANWAKMLQELEGKIIVARLEKIKINSIEQLMIDLELQGFLKRI